MAGTFSELGKNLLLDSAAASIVYVGLLDELDAEITTGVGDYARQPVNWDPASGGEMAADVIGTPIVILVPGAKTVNKVIYCSAQEGGTTYATDDVDNEVFTNEGTYTITSATLKIQDPA